MRFFVLVAAYTLASLSLVFVSFSPSSALAQGPTSPSGHRSCLTEIERRGTLRGQEICALSIRCEQRIEADRYQLVERRALCLPIARDNRCPEALDCIADTSVDPADAPNITNIRTSRASWDACPTEDAGIPSTQPPAGAETRGNATQRSAQ